MSRKNKIPYFLYNWRSAIVAFPCMALYCGFLPLLKVLNIVHISWALATFPIWGPFVGFFLIVGFVAFIALVTEIGFELLPDENILDGKKANEP